MRLRKGVALNGSPYPGLLELPAGEAHLWLAWTDRCSAPDRLAHYRSLLSVEEAGRLDRFAFEPLRLEYLVARALCRHSLSRYADIAPQAWRFAANEYGRPHVATPGAPAWLSFNLSHARSLVGCLVTRDVVAGVDVEETDRGVESLEIAERFFSATEFDALRALPAPQQRQRFFALWTLKESFIKALGTGLSTDLHAFSMELEAQSPIRIAFNPPASGVPDDWQFAAFTPSARHALAVCLRRGGDNERAIVIRETVPGDASFREIALPS